MTVRRVVYIGNFKVDYSTESHLRDTLRDMGHRVFTIQEDGPFVGDTARQCLDFGPDLLLYTKTWGFGGSHQLLDQYRLAGVPTATVHLDLFFGVHRESAVHGDAMFRTDHVFTADGGHAHDFANAGVNHHFLPPGVDKRACYLADVWDPRDEVDVTFVGSDGSGYHPEWPWRGQLHAALTKHYGHRFRARGLGGERIRGDALNRVYRAAKVVVGDSLMLGPFYWSDRIPETLGRGGVLATTCPDDETFDAMSHSVGYAPIATFEPGHVDQLIEATDMLLQYDDEMRQEIRQASLDGVLAFGTYHSRMQTMLDTIFGPDEETDGDAPAAD